MRGDIGTDPVESNLLVGGKLDALGECGAAAGLAEGSGAEGHDEEGGEEEGVDGGGVEEGDEGAGEGDGGAEAGEVDPVAVEEGELLVHAAVILLEAEVEDEQRVHQRELEQRDRCPQERDVRRQRCLQHQHLAQHHEEPCLHDRVHQWVQQVQFALFWYEY